VFAPDAVVELLGSRSVIWLAVDPRDEVRNGVPRSSTGSVLKRSGSGGGAARNSVWLAPFKVFADRARHALEQSAVAW
jgi:hypothetical protein